MKTASIIDYPRGDLDKQVWRVDGDNVELQPEIRDEIEDIVSSFLDDLDLPKDAVKDVLIYGSILTNQYNSKTDVDARILLDPDVVRKLYPEITGDSLYDIAVDIIHGVKLGETEHPLNATVVIEGEHTQLGEAPLGITKMDPVYSLKLNQLTNKGERRSEEFDPDVEFAQEKKDTTLVMDKLDKLIQDAKTQTLDFELIQEAVAEVKRPEVLIKRLEEKLEEINSTLAKLTAEYEKLKEERTQSYKEGPEEDKHNAPGNIKYKLLEKYKYIDLLKKLKRIFEGGVQKSEVPDVAETLKVKEATEKTAFPYEQRGPAEVKEAPPTSTLIPVTDNNPQSYEEGFWMSHGNACPHCGHENPKTANEESKELKCEACGKEFTADFHLNTGPSTNQYTKPYEGDEQIYETAQAMTPEEIVKMLQDTGVSNTVINEVQTKMKSPGTSGNKPNIPQAPTAPPSPGLKEPVPAKSMNTPNIQQQPIDKLSNLFGSVYMDHTIYNKPASLFDDGIPGKNPGDSPYADTGKSLAEGKITPKQKDGTPDEAVMHVEMVLTPEDIAPFVDSDLAQDILDAGNVLDPADILKAFPFLGNPDKRIDKAIASHLKHALVTEPDEGKGQYVAPSEGADYSPTIGQPAKPELSMEDIELFLIEHPRYTEEEVEAFAIEHGVDPFDLQDILADYRTELGIGSSSSPYTAKRATQRQRKDAQMRPPEGVESAPIVESAPEVSSMPEPKKGMDTEGAKALGIKIGIKWEEVKFTPEAFLKGYNVELEHGKQNPETNITDNDEEATGKIAWVHLQEDPEYYDKLEKLESGAEDYMKEAAVHMTLCPTCGSIQKMDSTCTICKTPITQQSKTDPADPTGELAMAVPKNAQPSEMTAKQAQQVPSKPRLDQKTRAVVNEVFVSSGLDGNGRFDRPQAGYSLAVDLMKEHGIEIAEIPNSIDFNQPQGRITVDIAWTNTADVFSPMRIDNSMLVVTWYKLDEDKYECLAYLS